MPCCTVHSPKLNRAARFFLLSCKTIIYFSYAKGPHSTPAHTNKKASLSTCFFWWWILCDSLIFRLLRAVAKNLRCSRLHSPKNLSRFFGCFDVRSSLQTALSFILLSAKFHLFRCSSSSQHNALRSALCWDPCKAKGPHSTLAHTNKKASLSTCFFLVGGGGFGPPKRNATDLQSAPFGHSGTRPLWSW